MFRSKCFVVGISLANYFRMSICFVLQNKITSYRLEAHIGTGKLAMAPNIELICGYTLTRGNTLLAQLVFVSTT